MPMTIQKMTVPLCAALVLLTTSSAAGAQAPSASSSASQENAIPVLHLISNLAKRTGKKFVVDPRVRSDVILIEANPATLSYADFLAVMQVHGFAAVESGGIVRVVPESAARHLPTPIVSGTEMRPDAEYITRIIPVKSMPAAMLVPVLRPLVPQQGHLVAVACSNVLILADTFGNARRIESLVQSLDTGEAYKREKCVLREPAATREGSAIPPAKKPSAPDA